MQRYLSKHVLSVVVPFAEKLQFPVSPNVRRDHMKLLSLIRAVTLLKRLQREVKEDTEGQYIESTIEDYKVAYELYLPLLKNPEDDLSERARDFLKLLNGQQETFTRREMMEKHSWSYRKVWDAMVELLHQEIIVEDGTYKGKAPEFRLLTNAYIPESTCKGLVTPTALQKLYARSSKGVER